MNSRKSNLILRADSYKYSHFKLFPKGTINNFSYVESRGVDTSDGMLTADAEIVFFGLQAYIKEYLLTQFNSRDVNEAERLIKAHGLPFNRADWDKIVNEYNGYLPLKISALPEGTVIKPGIMMANVVATDPEFAWLASFVETSMLRGIWYPTTVATLSREVKKVIKKFLEETSDDPKGQLPFKLHDFGGRGVSSAESAELGGMAHLINFLGTDTVEGLVGAIRYYNAEGPVGYSIPASEHSTMTAWGRDGELSAFSNMLDVYKDYPLIACVSDSYDIFNAVENLWPQLKDKMVENETMVVVRPDSGDPVETDLKVIETLGDKFGYEINSKGYKVLNNVRIIQGDGVNPRSIKSILIALKNDGWSIDNIAFGMGGALLQKVNRDTLKFAQKTSAIQNENGSWTDVYKEPVNEPFKKSKKGLLDTVKDVDGNLKTVRFEDAVVSSELQVAYKFNADMKEPYVRDVMFDDVRKNAEVK